MRNRWFLFIIICELINKIKKLWKTFPQPLIIQIFIHISEKLKIIEQQYSQSLLLEHHDVILQVL